MILVIWSFEFSFTQGDVKHLVEGFPLISMPNQVCRSCATRKQHRTSFPKASAFRAKKPLKLIYVDICEPNTPHTLREVGIFSK